MGVSLLMMHQRLAGAVPKSRRTCLIPLRGHSKESKQRNSSTFGDLGVSNVKMNPAGVAKGSRETLFANFGDGDGF